MVPSRNLEVPERQILCERKVVPIGVNDGITGFRHRTAHRTLALNDCGTACRYTVWNGNNAFMHELVIGARLHVEGIARVHAGPCAFPGTIAAWVINA